MTYEILETILDGLEEKPKEFRWDRGIPLTSLKCDYYSELSKEDLFTIIELLDFVIGNSHLDSSDDLYEKLYGMFEEEYSEVISNQEEIDSIPDGEVYLNNFTGEWEDLKKAITSYKECIEYGEIIEEDYPSVHDYIKMRVTRGDYTTKSDYIFKVKYYN